MTTSFTSEELVKWQSNNGNKKTIMCLQLSVINN